MNDEEKAKLTSLNKLTESIGNNWEVFTKYQQGYKHAF